MADTDLLAVQQTQTQQGPHRERPHFPFAAQMPFSFAILRRFEDMLELVGKSFLSSLHLFCISYVLSLFPLGGTNPAEKFFSNLCQQSSCKSVSFDVRSAPLLLQQYLSDFIALKVLDPHPESTISSVISFSVLNIVFPY